MSKYTWMVFVGACSYGILSTIVKLAYWDGYAIEVIAVMQALIGFCCLWIFSLFTKTTTNKVLPLQGKSKWLVIVSGGCIGLTSYVYYLSVKYIPASVAIICLMQFTWMSVLLEWCLFKKRPSQQQLGIITIILLATYLASGLQDSTNIHWKGLSLATLSALMYAGYVVLNARLPQTGGTSITRSMYAMLGSVITLSIITFPGLIAAQCWNLQLFRWVILLAFFGTIIPPLLFAGGIPKIGAGKSAVIMTAELPVAIISACVILHEPIASLQWWGVGLLLASIVYMKTR
ncbi:EamA family transporter [Chitinophaga skermanii]|nr:DMT family transporter [Chitinophaga skermanii]